MKKFRIDKAIIIRQGQKDMVLEPKITLDENQIDPYRANLQQVHGDECVITFVKTELP